MGRQLCLWHLAGSDRPEIRRRGYDQPFIQKAADWLKSVQKSDGSFGETCLSYHDTSLKGQGHSTASQTAWGAMGLLAAAGPNDPP